MVSANRMCYRIHLSLLDVQSSSIGNAQREGASSRDRRPSDKVAAQRKLFPNALKVGDDVRLLQVKPNERSQN